MRIAYFDSGDPEMYFDNPNLIWSNPSYLLEAGDPGYVGPAPSVSEPKTKHKKMKHNDYYPSRQADQVIWLVNYSGKLPGYATALGLTTGQVTPIVADCAWIIYLIEDWLPATRTWAQSCTDALIEAQTGTGSAAQVLPVFTPPALPAGVVAVLPGALNRIFAQVQAIKDSGKCTDTIATNLGLVGSEKSGPDLGSLLPVISVSIVSGHVVVKWGWGGNGAYLDSCEIWVDRGDGHGFVFLTIDTTPNYTDTQPLPATPAKWTYKAAYRVGETLVGQWSAPVSLTVGA
jgi:hypothetical protein